MADSPRPDPEVLLAHAPFVREMARALLHGDSRAEDVAQDTFVVALQRGPRRPGFLRAWLAGVVRNLVFTIHRRDAARLKREQVAARTIERRGLSKAQDSHASRRHPVDPRLLARTARCRTEQRTPYPSG